MGLYSVGPFNFCGGALIIGILRYLFYGTPGDWPRAQPPTWRARVFFVWVSEIWGAYFQEGLFFICFVFVFVFVFVCFFFLGGGGGGLLSEFYGIAFPFTSQLKFP